MTLIERFAICLLVTVSAFAKAQSSATIEVKPARSADPQSTRVRVLSSGDLIATSVNVIMLISQAYDVPSNSSDRLSTLPPWVYTERYDITLKAPRDAKPINPSGSNATTPVHDIFRRVLADKFHLAIRTENKSMPVYALVVAGSAPRLKRANVTDCIFDTAPGGCHSFVIGFGHPLNANAVTMDDLAHYIENWTDLPTVNRTNLKGLFTMHTGGWLPMRLPPPPPNGNGNADFSHLPTIDTVLGQLGLQLRRQNATVAIYTVEHVEQPSAK